MAGANAVRPQARAAPRSTWERVVKAAYRDRYLYLIFALPFAYFVLFHYLPIYGIIHRLQELQGRVRHLGFQVGRAPVFPRVSPNG